MHAPRLALRLALLITAAGWGLGALPLVMGDGELWRWLATMAGGSVPEHPVFAYWVRMAACVCVLVAVLALWCAARVPRDGALAWMLTGFQLATAGALAAWGAGLGLASAVYATDVAFCATTGLAQAVLLIMVRCSAPRPVRPAA